MKLKKAGCKLSTIHAVGIEDNLPHIPATLLGMRFVVCLKPGQGDATESVVGEGLFRHLFVICFVLRAGKT